MQISIKGYITSKKSELFSDCADRYAINTGNHKFAISDGVSKSFFPKYWAQTLVQKFVESKEESIVNLLLECQKKWIGKVTEIVNKPGVKWFTQNAYNRKDPGLATFVGLQFFVEKKEWKVSALGDSFLFFIPEDKGNEELKINQFSSKPEPILFDNFPDYFSSIGQNHKGKIKIKTEKLQNGTFYLMTDALAEWFINEKKDAVGKMGVWQSQKDFERFVDEERLLDKLGNDDSAILIINVKENKKEGFTYVDEDVSNIEILIKNQEKELEMKDVGKQDIEIKEEEKEKKSIRKNELKEESVIEKNKISTFEGVSEVAKKSSEANIEKSFVEKVKQVPEKIVGCFSSKKQTKPETTIEENTKNVESVKQEVNKVTKKEEEKLSTDIVKNNEQKRIDTEKIEPKLSEEVDFKKESSDTIEEIKQTKSITDKF